MATLIPFVRSSFVFHGSLLFCSLVDNPISQVGYVPHGIGFMETLLYEVLSPLEASTHYMPLVLEFQAWSREIIVEEANPGMLEAIGNGVIAKMGSGWRGIKLH